MLEAMGIFYLNVIKHSSWLRNLGLAMLIVPMASRFTRLLDLSPWYASMK